MIEVCKLTKRHVDQNCSLSKNLERIKVFSLYTGHGVGTIDFVECVMTMDDLEYEEIVNNSKDYAKFKLNNLIKYSEIEIFPEHIEKLKDSMANCDLKDLFLSLKEGYFVLRKKN